MKRLLLAAPLVLGWPVAAAAQEPASSPWVETRFHRVHLRNGNFIDGQLVQQNAKGVVLQMNRNGDFAVRKDLIQRVEYVKMRSLKEVPRIPVVESSPEAPDAEAAGKTPASKTPRAETVKLPTPGSTTDAYRPEIMKAVDAILTTHAIARSDMRRDLAPQIRALGAEAMAYACWVARSGREGIDKEALIEAIGQLDSPDTLPTLLAIAASAKDSFDRGFAVKVLARRDSPEARAAVHRALGDRSGQVWRVAQEEILKLHERKQADVDFVVSLLNDREDKSVIAQTLGKIGGDAALDALHGLLSQGNSADKVAAMRALGSSSRAEDLELALELLQDPDVNLRQETCLFIGRGKHGSAVPKLIGSLKDEDAKVGQNAHWALRNITGQAFDPLPDRWQVWWEQVGRARFAAPSEK